MEKDNLQLWPLNYRPRGSLARVLYEKTRVDNYLDNLDKSEWYKCELDRLSAPLASSFVQLHADEDTLDFLNRSEEKSDWILTQIWHAIAKSFLSLFMTQTSINGWLQRGSMFVLSLTQFQQLIKMKEWRGNSMLDLGAGDGTVTACISQLFEKTYVTEVSQTMRVLLQKRGYETLDVDDWHVEKKYDLISCLNLLDRCNQPQELLKQIRDSLTPGGRVLIAVVLPFSPYVETGSKNHKPNEILPISGSSFEQQVNSLVCNVFTPSGFDVISWSRVPYLCEGDLRQSYYWLDDAVFMLKVASRPSATD